GGAVARTRWGSAALEVLAQRADVPVVVLDEAGRVGYINPFARARLGVRADEAIGATLAQLAHPRELDEIERLLGVAAEVSRDGVRRVWTGTARALGALGAGDVELLPAEGSNVVCVGVAPDTERREREQLLDMASDAIAVFELNGRVVSWNESAAELLGWSQEDAVRALLWEVLGLGEGEARQLLAEVRSRGTWRGKLEYVARDGSLRRTESSWTLVDGIQGEQGAVLMIAMDVTQREALKRQSMRSERVERVALMARGIAHDLNNMLAPVPTYTHMLRMELEDKLEDLSDIGAIEAAVDRATQLLQNVLEFSRASAHTRRKLVLWAELIEHLGRTVLATFPKSIQVVLELRAREAVVLGEPTQLEQVLLHLCVNARDAMRDGGRLGLRLDIADEGGPRPAQLRPGRYAVVTVSDTGAGIEAPALEEIFAPFYTTKQTGRGAGLGLARTHQIVREHDGSITVESEVGVGSHFAVWIPLVEDDKSPGTSPPRG
ncbi:MAG: PAS domain S-box protein, partial [Myxococcota bacterium]